MLILGQSWFLFCHIIKNHWGTLLHLMHFLSIKNELAFIPLKLSLSANYWTHFFKLLESQQNCRNIGSNTWDSHRFLLSWISQELMHPNSKRFSSSLKSRFDVFRWGWTVCIQYSPEIWTVRNYWWPVSSIKLIWNNISISMRKLSLFHLKYDKWEYSQLVKISQY